MHLTRVKFRINKDGCCDCSRLVSYPKNSRKASSAERDQSSLTGDIKGQKAIVKHCLSPMTASVLVWCTDLTYAIAASSPIQVASPGSSEYGTPFVFLHLRVPHISPWCSLAIGHVVPGFQRFRNTKNTKNTVFLMIILPAPRKGLMPAARQAPSGPNWQRTLTAGGGGARTGNLQLIVVPRSLA